YLPSKLRLSRLLPTPARQRCPLCLRLHSFLFPYAFNIPFNSADSPLVPLLLPGSPVSFRFFFQAEDGIRDRNVTGVQTCALPISHARSVTEPAMTRVRFDASTVTSP